MKIDFVVNSLVAGGAERVLILLANNFDKKGHDVTIITFNEPEVFSANPTVKRVRLHNGNIKNHTIRSTINLYKYYSNKNNRPDVLMPFMTQTNFIGALIGKLRGLKVVSAEHNNHLRATDFIGKLARKYMYRKSDALTVLTKFDEQHYKSIGVNVYVMPNPCTFDIYEESKRNRKKIILAVGDLNRYHHKGFDNLIPLITPVLKKNPQWKLKLVGGGDDGTKLLKELTQKHQIEDQVIFEGYSTKVAELMTESEIYVLSSRTEGLPMVLTEAFARGTACIAFDCVTGPSDIIIPNVNGILIEDQNYDAMAESLEKLMNDAELRIKLTKGGVNSLDRYKMDAVYNKYLNIFDDILNK
ncbi:glycosyltransferase family 4 protein [Winogradskyella eckloniae]|uniref:glycosyltransferase family 4 protein n=1 Tax=Winogradskyella eckloniae TaxID=1089306 RepID=UPI0015640EA8|nr:glycosyltransferase family 4 protein [Winogradskyella eckloniae]NRD20148.1 glycosyltransferase family 4 protein [Winogradskyella eckloniae]